MMTSFSQAKELLGASPAYSLDDVERVFGVTFTPEQRTALENIPFSDEVLTSCARTHILFPALPLSLLDIREKRPDRFRLMTDYWYDREEEVFSRATMPIRWHLLRKKPVPGSFSRSWDEQTTELLLADEEVPSAATVAFAMILHHNMSGIRLFHRCTVRVSDKCSLGYRVGVCGEKGKVEVRFYFWDGNRRGYLGLSSALKPLNFAS